MRIKFHKDRASVFLTTVLIPYFLVFSVGAQIPEEKSVRYSFTDISTNGIPGYIHYHATGINNQGDVVGSAFDALGSIGSQGPWVWNSTNGVMSALQPGPYERTSDIIKINDSGQIAGTSLHMPDGSWNRYAACSWHRDNPGVVTQVQDWAQVIGIANSGMIAGWAHKAYTVMRIRMNSNTHTDELMPIEQNPPVPVCWFNNQPTWLLPPNLNVNTPLDEIYSGWYGENQVVSRGGMVAGIAFRDWGANFFWPPIPNSVYLFQSNNGDGEVVLAQSSDVTTGLFMPFAINDAGWMSGYSQYYWNGGVHAIWKNGVVSPLPGLGVGGWDYAMNNAGQIVGQDFDSLNGGYPAAAIWSPDPTTGQYTVENLNDLIPPDDAASFHLYRAYDINEAGQIVALGVDANGQDHAIVLTPMIGIRVDANRDGEITFDGKDSTTKDKPFRFWLNDDRDVPAEGTQEDVEVNNQPDYLHNQIVCIRDLEDFARVHIEAPTNFDPNDSTWEVKLQFTDVTDGSPAVNLWRAVKPGTEYLTDANVAQQQINFINPVIVTTREEKAIPLDLFANTDKKAAILFEGRTAGKGALRVRFYKSGQKVIEGKVYLDLKRIADMYEHYTVGDAIDIDANNIPPEATRISTFAYTSQSPEEPNYILYVHGWRVQPWERRAFAETAYKRLWWQGYKGRFGLYSWPTEWNPGTYWSHATDPQNYDRSERKAWVSAYGLQGVLENLNEQYPGQVRVFAHSMGNVVVSETLVLEAQRQVPQRLIHTYVPTQAASVAHAYDPNAPTILAKKDRNTPNVYAEYPPTGGQPYFKDIRSIAPTIVNYFNFQDYALTGPWELNQQHKPDELDGYHYSKSKKKGFYYDPNIASPIRPLILPVNRDEIFARCAQAWSGALGTQPGVRGPIGGEINMNQAFDFRATSTEHSAQFNYDIQLRKGYWKQLLKTFDLDQE